jgi:hypothetical protein
MPKKKTKQRKAKKKAIGDKQKTRQAQRERTRMNFDGMGQLFNGAEVRSKG